MLAGIRKRLTRKHLDTKDSEDDDKDDVHTFTPTANYIKISQGKIQLVHQSKSLENDATTDAQNKKDKEVLEKRIGELEGTVLHLQEQVNNSQNASPTFEKELREQLENMNRVMRSKERKQIQTCRDHKVLQTRFARQENLLHAMQQENKSLLLRVRQYEHCLDDVMRKVVDAIVAEDNLREEVAMLKSRVRDLEAQNAALSASPAKGRDEGYCTMSSGQPQPSNGHLEDLPEEPEQWLLPAEPCSTEMEDWSMSQEELAVITLDEERELNIQRHQQKRNGEQDWIWNSNDFLNSTMVETDSISDGISQLLQQKIVYSEDEEVTCTEFTNDFYKLVNIRSDSTRSLYSYIEDETDDEDDDDDSSCTESNARIRSRTPTSRQRPPSPTPSEAGRAQVTSCSSSESSALSRCTTHQESNENNDEVDTEERLMSNHHSDIKIEDVQLDSEHCLHETRCIEDIIKTELRRPPHILVKSKSIQDEDGPSCILRNSQRRGMESRVVRSESVNCGIAGNPLKKTKPVSLQDRILQKPVNSWRKSNGWKRVTSPIQSPTALISTKKEIKSGISKTPQATVKMAPTKIPSCTIMPQQPNLLKQQQQIRKSKIPPPVPVRRSYAS